MSAAEPSKGDQTEVRDAAAAAALPADAGVASGAGGSLPADAAEAPGAGASQSDPGIVPPMSSADAGAGDSGSGLPGPLGALPIDPELLEQKPEILVGAAFAGGFVFAKILRHIGGS